MDQPTMYDPYQVTPDVDVLPAYFSIPGLGIVPVNAFVLKAATPNISTTSSTSIHTRMVIPRPVQAGLLRR